MSTSFAKMERRKEEEELAVSLIVAAFAQRAGSAEDFDSLRRVGVAVEAAIAAAAAADVAADDGDTETGKVPRDSPDALEGVRGRARFAARSKDSRVD